MSKIMRQKSQPKNLQGNHADSGEDLRLDAAPRPVGMLDMKPRQAWLEVFPGRAGKTTARCR
jgi:hypothetical protein